jgi:L-threonylcarbamoyladenylate synthase
MTNTTPSGAKEALLLRASETIRGGGVVIAATETFYGVLADPFQEDAVGRIFSIKRRDLAKPLPLIAADMETVLRVVEDPEPLAAALMKAFWPGSLTLLLRPNRPVPRLLLGAGNRIGVRVAPPCPASAVAGLSGGWITATSANLSGDPNPREISRIDPAVIAAVDLVVDMGPSPGGLPSTVVDCDGARFRILREGAVPESELRRVAS